MKSVMSVFGTARELSVELAPEMCGADMLVLLNRALTRSFGFDVRHRVASASDPPVRLSFFLPFRDRETDDMHLFDRWLFPLVSINVQLKTWDFVELSQEESYGDIKVTAGVSGPS